MDNEKTFAANQPGDHDEVVVDQICDKYETFWRNSDSVSLAKFIGDLDPLPSKEIIFELVRIDIDRRSLKGLTINSDSYSKLLPDKKEAIQNLVSIQMASLTKPIASPKFKVVGNYELLRLLGEGGMGEVYLARHKMLESKSSLAIKLIRPDKVKSQEAKQRFLREIDLLGQLGDHENVVVAQDAGDFDGVLYMVMDFVEGFDCHQLLKRNDKPVPIADACEIIRQACMGIQYAHDHEIIHRDIKPGNLMLSKDGKIKILDLGLARFIDNESDDVTIDRSILGTIHYVAPEQIEDPRSVKATADIYSLGCTLYALLTGKPPFGHGGQNSDLNVICKQIADKPSDVREFRREIPSPLANLISKSLEKDPTSRIQTAKDFADALLPFCKGNNLIELVPGAGDAIELRDTDAKQLPTRGNTITKKAPTCSITLAITFAILLLGGFLVFQGLEWKKRSDFAAAKRMSELEDAADMSKHSDQPFSIQYITREKKELSLIDQNQVLTNRGTIGQEVFATEFGEAIKLEIDLGRSAHFYIFALNPTDDVKWAIQLCYPEEDVPPVKRRRIRYPEKTTQYFPLTDGVGQLAFVLVYSESPLPEFTKWRTEYMSNDFPWKVTRRAGVWVHDGQTLSQLNRSKVRGDVVEMESPVLEDVTKHLLDRGVTFRVFAFNVDAASTDAVKKQPNTSKSNPKE